jgi:hypothetical protein
MPVRCGPKAGLRGRLAEAEAIVRREGTPGGFIEDVSSSEIARVTARMLHVAADGVTEALGRGDEAEALWHVGRLPGLGPGLTPWGDDFLLGLLAARALCRSRNIASDAFARGVARLSETATNLISRAALAKAARGEVRDGIARLVFVLWAPADEPLSQALARVLAIGSSSGTEIALGVIRGLASIIDNGEWDHGHQERH